MQHHILIKHVSVYMLMYKSGLGMHHLIINMNDRIW
jgi:hypothetical protein